MKRLLYALSDHKSRFTGVLFFALGLNAISTAADPLIMKLLIDEGLIKRNFQLFAMLAAAVVLFAITLRGISLSYELLSQKLRNTIAESLTLRMLKAYFETPYAEIAKSDNGYFISRMYDEPVKVARGVVSTGIGLLVSLITFVVAFAISLYLTW